MRRYRQSPSPNCPFTAMYAPQTTGSRPNAPSPGGSCSSRKCRTWLKTIYGAGWEFVTRASGRAVGGDGCDGDVGRWRGGGKERARWSDRQEAGGVYIGLGRVAIDAKQGSLRQHIPRRLAGALCRRCASVARRLTCPALRLFLPSFASARSCTAHRPCTGSP